MDIKDIFNDLHDENNNFNGLYNFIIENDVVINFVRIKVNNAAGMAAFDQIFIDKELIYTFDKETLFIVIAHEIGHYLSFRKRGYQYHLDLLCSNDWDIFFAHVIHEEIFADKIASLLYYKLNGVIYSGNMKQELHLKSKQNIYETAIKDNLFGLFTNDLNHYNELVESLIER